MRRISAKRRIAFLFTAALLVWATGCDFFGDDGEDIITQRTRGVYVANQGNFSDANGSVTRFDPASAEAMEVLGGVSTIFQSLDVFGGRVYAVANTGGRIEVLDAASGARQPPIDGLTNPRYLAFVDETKAYVTNQVFRFGGVTDKSFVSVIDLETGAVRDTLQVPGQPDHIALAAGRAYVTLGIFAESRLVGVIDTETDELIDVIDVGCVAPRYLVVDAEEDVHVICSGTVDFGTGAETPGTLVMLDGETGAIRGRIEATTLLAPNAANIGTGQDAAFSARNNRAFVIAGPEILVLDTATNRLVDTLVLGGDDLISGLAYDDVADRLYVTRHDGSFTTTGRVEVYAPGATVPEATFDAAIAPIHLAFFR